MYQIIKKTAVFSLKLILILGLFLFLIWQANKHGAFEKLAAQPKNWSLLLAAVFCQLCAVFITFLRWRSLAKALDLPMPLKEAFRLGFLGLLFNLAPMGIVGGDAIKAFLLAKQNPDARSRAVASVIVDRLIGLLVMFMVGTLLIFWTGFAFRTEIFAKTATNIVLILTLLGYTGVGIVFLPFFSKGHTERLIEKIPYCGSILGKLTRALLLYRNQKSSLFISFLISFFVHIFFGLSLAFVANGLFSTVPDTLDQVMLHQITNLTSMIPLAAGPYEFVLDQLYTLFTVHGEAISLGIGLLVAIGFRLTSIFVAALGIIYYLSSRAELNDEQLTEAIQRSGWEEDASR